MQLASELENRPPTSGRNGGVRHLARLLSFPSFSGPRGAPCSSLPFCLRASLQQVGDPLVIVYICSFNNSTSLRFRNHTWSCLVSSEHKRHLGR